MNKKINKESGFTLIELIIAMSIFVMFIGILMSSYTNIITSQRDANMYRHIYSDARSIFEKITDDARNCAIDYADEDFKNDFEGKRLALICPSGDKISISSVGENLEYKVNDKEAFALNSDKITISKFKVYAPKVDVFAPNSDQSAIVDPTVSPYQNHPKVTVFVEFKYKISNTKKYTLPLQTSISTRSYSSIK
ncbi:MAG: type II secretion system protein [Candidatus Gracilibacteria bacterium]|jgi:prepilin-type N-terminal cleavage/methylation domain-containing protein